MAATDLFNYHKKIFDMFTGNRTSNTPAGGGAITAYNGKIRVIKDSYGLTTDQLKGLILYSFVHNPFNHEEVSCYGRIDEITKCCASFVEWCDVRREEIHEAGLARTIIRYKPTKSKLRQSLENEIEQAYSL